MPIDGNQIIVGAFLLLTLIVGLWAGRHVKTLKDYAVANRKLGPGVLSMTFFATLIGGKMLFMISARGFSYGIIMVLPFVGVVFSLVWLGVFLSPKIAYF